MNTTKKCEYEYYTNLNRLIKIHFKGNDIAINSFIIKNEHIIIKTNNWLQNGHDEILEFYKNIFKFEEYKIINETHRYFDISFTYTEESLKYLDKIMVFQ